MDTQRHKWVNLSFLSAAALFGYITFSLMGTVAALYDVEARVENLDLYMRGLSVAFGLGLFVYFYTSQKINQYMHEVVAELARVTYPTGEDTYKTTIVVMIVVIILGAFLGGLDSFWSWMLQGIL